MPQRNTKQAQGKSEEMEVDTSMIELFENMIGEMFEYGKHILQEKRLNPKDDLLSAIANAELDGAKAKPRVFGWLMVTNNLCRQ